MTQRNRNRGNAITEQYGSKLETLINELAKVSTDDVGRRCVDQSKSLVVEILTDMKGSARSNEERKNVLEKLKRHTGNLSQMQKAHQGSFGHKFFAPVITELQNGQSALATIVGPQWSNQGDPSGPSEKDAFEEWEESEEDEDTDGEGKPTRHNKPPASTGDTSRGRASISGGPLNAVADPTPADHTMWSQWTQSEGVDDDEAILLHYDDGSTREMMEEGEGDMMRMKVLKMADIAAKNGSLINPDLVTSAMSSSKFREIAPNGFKNMSYRLWNILHLALLCIAGTLLFLLAQQSHVDNFDRVVQMANEEQVYTLERALQADWKLLFGSLKPKEVGEEGLQKYRQSAVINSEALSKALRVKSHDPILHTQSSWPGAFSLYNRTAITLGSSGRGNGAGGAGATQRVTRLTHDASAVLCTAAALSVSPDLASGVVLSPPVRDEEVLQTEGCSLANGFGSIARRAVSGNVMHLPATQDHTGRMLAMAGVQVGGFGGLGMVVEYSVDRAFFDSYRKEWESRAVNYTAFGIGIGFIISLLLVETLSVFLPIQRMKPLVLGCVFGLSVGLVSTLCLMVGVFVSWDSITTGLLDHELRAWSSSAVTFDAAFNIHYTQYGAQLTNESFIKEIVGYDFPFSKALIQPLREAAVLGEFEALVYDAQGTLLASTVDPSKVSQEDATMVSNYLNKTTGVFYGDTSSKSVRKAMISATSGSTTTFLFKAISLEEYHPAAEGTTILFVACFVVTSLLCMKAVASSANSSSQQVQSRGFASMSSGRGEPRGSQAVAERSAFSLSTAGIHKLTTSTLLMSGFTLKNIPVVVYTMMVLTIGATSVCLGIFTKASFDKQAFETYKSVALPRAALLGSVVEWAAERAHIDTAGIAKALSESQPSHTELLSFSEDDGMLYPTGAHELRHPSATSPLWLQFTLSSGTRRAEAGISTTVPQNSSYDQFPSQTYNTNNKVVSTSWSGEQARVVLERLVPSIVSTHETFSSILVIMCLATCSLSLTIFLLELLFRWLFNLRFELKDDVEYADQWCEDNSVSDTVDLEDTRKEYTASANKRIAMATLLALFLAVIPAAAVSLSALTVIRHTEDAPAALIRDELAEESSMLTGFLVTTYREIQQRVDTNPSDFLAEIGLMMDVAMHSSRDGLLRLVVAQQQKSSSTNTYAHRTLNTGGFFAIGEALQSQVLPSKTQEVPKFSVDITNSVPTDRVRCGQSYGDQYFCTSAFTLSKEAPPASGQTVDSDGVFHLLLMFDAKNVEQRLVNDFKANILDIFGATAVSSFVVGILIIAAGLNGFFKARLVRDAPVSEGRRKNLRLLTAGMCILPILVLTSIVLTRVYTLEEKSVDQFRSMVDQESEVTKRRALIAHGMGAVHAAVKALVTSNTEASTEFTTHATSVDTAWFATDSEFYTGYLATLVASIEPLLVVRSEMGDLETAESTSSTLFTAGRLNSEKAIFTPLRFILSTLRTESDCLTHVNPVNATLLKLQATLSNKVSQILSLRQMQQQTEDLLLALLNGAEDTAATERGSEAEGISVAVTRLDDYAAELFQHQAALLEPLAEDLAAYLSDSWVVSSTTAASCHEIGVDISARAALAASAILALQNTVEGEAPVFFGQSSIVAAEARVTTTPLSQRLLYYNHRRGLEAFNTTYESGYENIVSLLIQAEPHLHLFVEQLFQLDAAEEKIRVLASTQSLLSPSAAEVEALVRTSQEDIVDCGIGCTVTLFVIIALVLLHTAILDPSKPKQQVMVVGLGGLFSCVLCVVMAFGASRGIYDYVESARTFDFGGVGKEIGSLDLDITTVKQLSSAADFWANGADYDIRVETAEGFSSLDLAQLAANDDHAIGREMGVDNLLTLITKTDEMRRSNTQDLRYAQQTDVDAYLRLASRLLDRASTMFTEDVDHLQQLLVQIEEAEVEANDGWIPVTTKMAEVAKLVAVDLLGSHNSTLGSSSNPAEAFFNASAGGDLHNQYWIPQVSYVGTMSPHYNETTLYSLGNSVLYEKALLTEDSINYNLTSALVAYHATLDLGLTALQFENLLWSQLIRGSKLTDDELTLVPEAIARYNQSSFTATLDSVGFATPAEKSTAQSTFAAGLSELESLIGANIVNFELQSKEDYVALANNSANTIGQGLTASDNASAIVKALLVLGYVGDESGSSDAHSEDGDELPSGVWRRVWLPIQYEVINHLEAEWSVDQTATRPRLEELVVSVDLEVDFPSLQRDSVTSLAAEVVATKGLYRADFSYYRTGTVLSNTSTGSGRTDSIFHTLLVDMEDSFEVPRRAEEWLSIVTAWVLSLAVAFIYYRQRKVATVAP